MRGGSWTTQAVSGTLLAVVCACVLRCAYFDTSAGSSQESGQFTAYLEMPTCGECTVYRITITGPDIDPISFYQLAGGDSIRLAIPPGAVRYFTVEAFDRSGQRRYWWRDTVDIVGQTAVHLRVELTAVSLEPATALVLGLTTTAEGWVHLSWNAVTEAEFYEVFRSADTSAQVRSLGVISGLSFVDSTVVCGTRFFYKVVAANRITRLSSSGFVSTTVPCRIVSGLQPPVCTLSVLACSSVVLGWKPVDDAVAYRVYRYSAEVPEGERLGQTTALCWRDTRIQGGRSFEYAVSCVVPDGESPMSGRIAAVIPYCQPLAPRAVRVASQEPGTVTVDWDSVWGATSYIVWRVDVSAGARVVPVCTTRAICVRDTGLTPGATYRYRVAAVNPVGQSDFAESQAVSVMYPVPSRPLRIRAVSLSAATVSVVWSPVVYASRYALFRSVGTETAFLRIYEGVDTAWIDTGLAPSTSYAYYVRAGNASGWSPGSDTVTAVTQPPSVQKPQPPEGATAVAMSATVVRVEWRMSTGAVRYVVYRSGAEAGPYGVVGETTALSFTDSSVSSLSTYWYRVTAVNAAGESEPCAPVRVTTPALVSVPERLSAVAMSPTLVQLSWARVPESIEYRVYRRSAYDTGFVRVGRSTDTLWRDSGVQPVTTYEYAVSAVGVGGVESALSARVSVTTPASVPSVPSGVTATPQSATEIRISWNASAGADGYRVYASELSDGPYGLVAQVGSTFYVHTGLQPGTKRFYRVSAYNSAGESALSAPPVSATTPTVAIPATPEGVTARALSSSEIEISFLPSSGATLYRIYWSQSASGPFTLLTAQSSSPYVHRGLNPTTTYFYQVSAINSSGESPRSATVSATTLPAIVYRTYAVIDPTKCQNCRNGCSGVCPVGAIYKTTWEGRTVSAVDKSKCTGCGSCKTFCDNKGIGAITLVTEPVATALKALGDMLVTKP